MLPSEGYGTYVDECSSPASVTRYIRKFFFFTFSNGTGSKNKSRAHFLNRNGKASSTLPCLSAAVCVSQDVVINGAMAYDI